MSVVFTYFYREITILGYYVETFFYPKINQQLFHDEGHQGPSIVSGSNSAYYNAVSEGGFFIGVGGGTSWLH